MSNPHEPTIEIDADHAAQADPDDVQRAVDAAPVEEHPEAQSGG